MKRISIKIFNMVIAFVLIINVMFKLETYADVGGFQRYEDSSSSSSSSTSSSSSKDSYSSSDSYGSSGSSISSSTDGMSIGGAILLIFVLAAYQYFKEHGGTDKLNEITKKTNDTMEFDNNIKSVAEQIREIDPMFSEDDFLAWSKEVFIKLQKAWTKKEWSIIRPFETNELFEQHNTQLQEFIEQGKTNVVEKISVTSASLYSFKQDGDKETLKVTLRAVMRDYVIEDSSKKVIQGNPDVDMHMTYRLTFIRKAGVKTKEATNSKSTTNCPNCGAPTKVTSSGQCEYCGSVITTGEHDWVLSNLEGI